MHTKSSESLKAIPRKPIIQDMAIIAKDYAKVPAIGEALLPFAPAPEKPMTTQERHRMLIRLEKTIFVLMEQCNKMYQEALGQMETKEHPDYIARLSTNEFLFYTEEPLTLQEFEALQNKIAEKARSYPAGLHLILGTFAVKNAEVEVMNVATYIACGEKPECHFVIKNNTAEFDLRFRTRNDKGNVIWLPYFDKTTHHPDKALPSISVDGVQRYFTFNNIIIGHTPGGLKFLTVLQICLDHTAPVIELGEYSTDLPITQVIISNSISLQEKFCLVHLVAHTDPRHEDYQYKHSLPLQFVQDIRAVFGKSRLSVYKTSKYPILTQQEELTLAKPLLAKELARFNINMLYQSEISMESTNKTSILCVQKFFDKNAIPYIVKGGNLVEMFGDFTSRSQVITMKSSFTSRELLVEVQADAFAKQKAILKPAVDLFCANISGLVEHDYTYDSTALVYIMEPVRGIQLFFEENKDRHLFMAAWLGLSPFHAQYEKKENRLSLVCDINILNNKTLADSIIQNYEQYRIRFDEVKLAQQFLRKEKEALLPMDENIPGRKKLLADLTLNLMNILRILGTFQNPLNNQTLIDMTLLLNKTLGNIPAIKQQVKEIKQTILHQDMHVTTYYKNENRYHFFSIHAKGQEGDAAKKSILNTFKDILTQINNFEDLQTFKDSLQDIHHKNNQLFQTLEDTQGIVYTVFNQESSAITALRQMIADRESVIGMAYSL